MRSNLTHGKLCSESKLKLQPPTACRHLTKQLLFPISSYAREKIISEPPDSCVFLVKRCAISPGRERERIHERSGDMPRTPATLFSVGYLGRSQAGHAHIPHKIGGIKPVTCTYS